MFFRNKKKLTEADRGPAKPQPSQAAITALGRATLPEFKPKPSYYAEVRKRTDAIEAYNRDFLRAAFEVGVAEDRLPALVADAMNAGALPRILRGGQFRGSGFFLQLLDGVVPPEKIKVHLNIDKEGIYQGGSIDSVDDPWHPEEYPGLTVEGAGRFPQHPYGEQIPLNPAELAKLDAHMPAGYSSSEPQ